MLTGAKLLLVIAANETPLYVVVTDVVICAMGIKAPAWAFSPAAEHEVKPMASMKAR